MLFLSHQQPHQLLQDAVSAVSAVEWLGSHTGHLYHLL